MFRYSNNSKYKLRSRYQRIRPGRKQGDSVTGVFLLAMALIAASLLLLNRTGNRQLAQWRESALDFARPALEMTAIPAGYVRRSLRRFNNFYDLREELAHLQRENHKLESVEWNMAELRQRNSQLKALLNSVEEQRLQFISGRIISASKGQFGRSLLVNLGRRNGVNNGFAVLNADGFIGRTQTTGDRTSSILLLTDHLSRIPVIIGRQRVKGMVIGDGGPYPKISFLPRGSRIYEGDFVFTSGHGGDLPKGLRIGIVKKISGKYRIAPRASLQGMEYVSVLYFAQPGLARRE